MVKALFDANILTDCLNTVSQPTILSSDALKLRAIAMMNADQKRASFSAMLVFAELRQLTNEDEDARQSSILADGIQQDRCFLLSSYESVLLVHRIRALDVEDADVETNRKTIARSE
jgi:hypothetical protein